MYARMSPTRQAEGRVMSIIELEHARPFRSAPMPT